MSEEIIKVLNYIGDKLGIAIDWSSENVWPYVMDVLGRYRIMEVISNAVWLIVLLGISVAMSILLLKSAHGAFITRDELWYDDYMGGPSVLSIVLWVAVGIILCAIVIPFTIITSYNLLKWAVVPEIKYLDILKSYIQ